MNDTSSAVRQRMAHMIAQKSPARRLRMAADMYDMGKKLARAGIAQENPHIEEGGLKVMLFERMYGRDFSKKECEKIKAYLRRGDKRV